MAHENHIGIAFKVTFNDGGTAPGETGFAGVCSDQSILLNVRKRKITNCSDGTRCRQYADRGLRPGDRRRLGLGGWCYESTLFSNRRWAFGSGAYHRGERAGTPIPMSAGGPGDIVFLTTRFPDQLEPERSIFAIYRVGKRRVSANGEIELVSDGTMQVHLPDEVARRFRFWRYHDSASGPDWRTGLFRYLGTSATRNVLSELLYVLDDRDERDVLLRALDGWQIEPRAPTEDGGLRLPFIPRGEGDAHRRLKEHVAANPTSIGLPRRAKPHVEYAFRSGDRVDVLFELPNGSAAVVEIETIFTEPGAHQCIKYRALKEAARGDRIGGGSVEAILVAHRFDDVTRQFASRYGIRLVELRV